MLTVIIVVVLVVVIIVIKAPLIFKHLYMLMVPCTHLTSYIIRITLI